MRHRAAAAVLLLLAGPAAANSIVTAERPEIAPRGWTYQLEARPIYARSTRFVDRDGTVRDRSDADRQLLMIARVFTARSMWRVSLPLASRSRDGAGRYGAGDALFEGGALLRPGPWRLRLNAFVKAPTGGYDRAQAVNIGGGQWDFGPMLYVTRYFDEGRADADLFAQYSFRGPNAASGIRPGNEASWCLALAREVRLGVPVRAGLEQRGFFGEPDRRDGAAVSAARRSLSVGPVFLVKLDRFVHGFSLWPTAMFDVYDRNMPRTRQYYARVMYAF